MSLQKLANESMLDYKYRILIGKSKGEIEESWQEVFDALNIGLGIDSVKKGTIFLPEFEEYMINKLSTNKETPSYRETIELKKDGTTSSDKLIELSHAQMKDSEYILKAHGFNPLHFELVSAKHSVWNVSAGNNPNKTLYSSKVSVKPKVTGLNVDKLIEQLKESIDISELKYSEINGTNMLVIPFFDLHFGIANIETYKEVLSKTIYRIKSKKWNKILIVFGQDALHNDGFTGQTTSGTVIDKVDMEKAWSDLHQFYTFIFDEAIKNSNSVDAIFSNGNHDQSMGWAFGKLLEIKYPQVKFDSKMKQFKGYKWNNVFIGVTHGDKGANRIFDVYLSEYGNLIANAKTKEILTGHLHHQKTIDKFGLVHRTLGSGVPTDGYHADNGFVGAQKQFTLLEYNENYPEAVYYV